MIERTFCHLPGIGLTLERRLWAAGVATWDDFLASGRLPGLSWDRQERLADLLRKGRERLDDLSYWAAALPPSEQWRLYGRFRHRAGFLDIETDGLGPDWSGQVTLVGLYDGRVYRAFLNGSNLEEFELGLEKVGLLVTFNGSGFDLPVLRGYFRHLRLPPVHLDLRHLLKKLGFGGGLKKIEPLFGLARAADVDGLDGWDAVRLWRLSQEGDRSALSRLVRYNRADVVNLRPLMDQAYELLTAAAIGPGEKDRTL